MGLEAFVYCDCVENNRLKIPHPYPRLLYISPNGCPEIRSNDPALMQEHNDWKESNPCTRRSHEGLMASGCTLGNAWWITQVREILAASRNSKVRYPVLLGKVFYCSTHACDCLSVAQVRRLAIELKTLRKHLHDFSPAERRIIVPTITALGEPIKASLRINKPLAF